jgi:hypothetical protein
MIGTIALTLVAVIASAYVLKLWNECDYSCDK